MKEIINRADIALLAPVPLEHLISGLPVCKAAGKVAFGSNAFQTFRDLDLLREDLTCDVYIYPSDSGLFGKPKIRWLATYIRHVDSNNGRHPDGMAYRPTSSEAYPSDNLGFWACFWEVSDLRELSSSDALSMNRLKGAKTAKSYVSGFIPHGPVIVDPIELN